jgi:type I restriction enzyme R subunit
LRDALAIPPVAATPIQLWRAFQAVEPQAVQEVSADRRPGEPLSDLVQLVRHAVRADTPLTPYSEQVRVNYGAWKEERIQAGATFSSEQEEWLDRMAEHIATSLSIEPADFETGWFAQHGSLGRAHALFGDQLGLLLAELNEKLAA